MSVSDVMVMLTAASLIMWPMRSGTESFTDVLRQAASITNVSSIPIPVEKYDDEKLIVINYQLMFSLAQYTST